MGLDGRARTSRKRVVLLLAAGAVTLMILGIAAGYVWLRVWRLVAIDPHPPCPPDQLVAVRRAASLLPPDFRFDVVDPPDCRYGDFQAGRGHSPMSPEHAREVMAAAGWHETGPRVNGGQYFCNSNAAEVVMMAHLQDLPVGQIQLMYAGDDTYLHGLLRC